MIHLEESPPKLLKTGIIVISGTASVSLRLMPTFTFHSTMFKECMFQPFHPNASPGHPGITSWSLGMQLFPPSKHIKTSFSDTSKYKVIWDVQYLCALANLSSIQFRVGCRAIELSLPHPGGAPHHSGASSGPILSAVFAARKFTKTKNSPLTKQIYSP